MDGGVGRFAALSLSLSSVLPLGLFAPAHGQAPTAPSPLPAQPGSRLEIEALPSPLPNLQQPQDGQTRSPVVTGDEIALNGTELQAPWRLEGESGNRQRLFVPIDLLTHQLGFKVSRGAEGRQLVWFGHVFPWEETSSSLGGKPAVDIAPMARRFRWRFRPVASWLSLRVPPPRLINVRLERSAERVQIMLDFTGPAPFRLQDGELLVEMDSRDAHLREMDILGIPHQWTPGLLKLNTATLSPASHLSTFRRPESLVLDLAYEDFLTLQVLGPTKPAVLPQRPPFQRTTKVIALGEKKFRLHRVALDLTNPAVTMLPLTSADGMNGLNPLSALAKAGQADLAINGGYFNRTRKLPLGAIKREGAWLSGPILGRGAMGWGSGKRPVFGRLTMEEKVTDPEGSFCLTLTHLNSGYVKKGVARYTHRWGRVYTPLTQKETAVLVEGKRVVGPAFQIKGDVPLKPGSWLLVARYGAPLPQCLGDQRLIELDQRLTPGVFGRQPHVLGAGPLLLLDGKMALNPGLEKFSSKFQQQKAPRSVVAWGQDQLWFLTIQGEGNSGPTLTETARLAQELGMEDALNLDGGSSTTLVFQGATAVRGRGVNSRVHNGLGVKVRRLPGESGSRSNN